MSKPSPALRAAFQKLDALYAALPPIACAGKCGVVCTGGIFLTDLEARRLQLATHRKPRTTDAGGRCVYLTPADRCSAYAVRPLICRVWGVVRMLSCMHGCLPTRWAREQEFLDVARAVEALGGGRLLHTTIDGLAVVPGESFATLTITRPADVVEQDADRTRNLRALHGGRILVARQD